LTDFTKKLAKIRCFLFGVAIISAVTSFVAGLTKFQQDGLLDRFKDGSCKLIFATTVAEEGLDIKACNLVVTYNHTTSEVAQVQRKGSPGGA